MLFLRLSNMIQKDEQVCGEMIIMAPEHLRWDVLRSAIASQMLLCRSLITAVGEVDYGLLAQTRIKQGLGQK